MQIHKSAEDYLESILMMKQEKGVVRSIDIVRHLGVTKPSVSRAMSLLRKNGYITMDHEGFLELTQAGSAIAERIYERHSLLTQWLIYLGVPQDVAAEDACRIEHDISEVTFAKMKEHIESAKSRKPFTE